GERKNFSRISEGRRPPPNRTISPRSMNDRMEESVMEKVLVAVLAIGVAVAPSDGPKMTVVQTAERHWKPKLALPPAAFGANLWGDPATGPYGFVGKFPVNFRVPLHSHTNDVRVVMLKGNMVITYPGELEVEIAEGGYFLLPARRAYVASCAKGCEFLAFDQLPFDIIYADRKEDPRERKQ